MNAERTRDGEVRAEVYRFFVDHGRAPVPAEIGKALHLDQADVEAALQRLHDDHLLVLAPGTPYIWMANPLSALPTPYRVEAADRTWFANCIWDALGVVAMLGGDGSVTTWCADCTEPLEATVTGGAVAGSGVVHFAVPAAQWWDDIGFN